MEEQKKKGSEAAGPEEGLRSGSTAGDSHGQTVDAPAEGEAFAGAETPGERRKELLKEEGAA